jgi:hypothetical protein
MSTSFVDMFLRKWTIWVRLGTGHISQINLKLKYYHDKELTKLWELKIEGEVFVYVEKQMDDLRKQKILSVKLKGILHYQEIKIRKEIVVLNGQGEIEEEKSHKFEQHKAPEDDEELKN